MRNFPQCPGLCAHPSYCACSIPSSDLLFILLHFKLWLQAQSVSLQMQQSSSEGAQLQQLVERACELEVQVTPFSITSLLNCLLSKITQVLSVSSALNPFALEVLIWSKGRDQAHNKSNHVLTAARRPLEDSAHHSAAAPRCPAAQHGAPGNCCTAAPRSRIRPPAPGDTGEQSRA